MPLSVDVAEVMEKAPVGIEPAGARRFARPLPGTLLLTADELLVVSGPEEAPEVLMRQGRNDLAMVRRPTPRGGERVELAAMDGQQATLRFARAEVGAAGMLAAWLAGLPFRGQAAPGPRPAAGPSGRSA
jgi:hypothetical protein